MNCVVLRICKLFSILFLVAVLCSLFSCVNTERELLKAEEDVGSDSSNIVVGGNTFSPSSLPSIIGADVLAPYSEFSVKGEIESLRDFSFIDGYGTSNGFYRFIPREDGSSNLCYIDYISQQEVYLCVQPNCEHKDSTCNSWYPSNLGILLPIPIGDKIVILHGGSPNYFDSLGTAALAQIELINEDGTQREKVASFPASVTISTFPRGGFAHDEENVYFVLTYVNDSETLRTLCAVNCMSGKCFALFDLSEQEEKIVGGYKSLLVLSYTPNAYDLSVDAADLVTYTMRVDLSTGEQTSFCSYPYSSIGGGYQGRYWVLEPSGKLSSYDIATGNNLNTKTIVWPEFFDSHNMHFDGFVNNRIMVHSFAVMPNDTPSLLVYCAIDLQTGNISTLDWIREENDGYCADVVVSELENQLLFTYDQREIIVTLPDGMQMSYPWYQYALIDKSDFWNNIPAYNIIQSSL